MKKFTSEQQRIIIVIINQVLNARSFSSNFQESQKSMKFSKLNDNNNVDADDSK